MTVTPKPVSKQGDVKATKEDDVVVVDKVETSLEWTLTSPPPQHQFEESPIIVEIAHLYDEPAAH
jgi:heme/copper-type cytochrome/quinol oxidase subunit 1